jgi:hypothetical protein
MKRLMVLTVVTLLAGSSVGCGLCKGWPWNRGSSYTQCPPAVSYTDPCASGCATTVNACDPCGTTGVTANPGTPTYVVPSPTQ